MLRKSSLHSSPIAIALTAMAAGFSSISQAQMGLEEVLVTAQKRAESLQEIPVSISAFDTEAIEARGLHTAQDIGLASPSLQTPAYPTTSNNLGLFIRGIGNADSIVLTKDATVGIYYDGVYAARSTGLLADLSDLERVEILRGPQGTLYGRNTTAGAVNFITSKPAGALAFRQTLSAGNEGVLRAVSRLDLPDANGFKLRLTGSWSERDGWVENEGPNQLPGLEYTDYYDEEKTGYRIALRYDGVERLLVDYSYDNADMDTAPAYFQYGGPVGGLDPAFNPITDSFTDRLENTRTPTGGGKFAYYLPETNTEVEGHNLTLSYGISDRLSFKSITGYREFDDDLSQNFSQSFGNAGTIEANTMTDHEQFSQEFQLLGSVERLEYVAGAYYFDEEGDQEERQYLDRATVDSTGIIALDLTNFPPTPCSDGSTADPICTDFSLFFPLYLGMYTVDTDVESWSVYGQATWTPDLLQDRLDLTLGLRYTDDDRESVRTNDGLLWNPFGPGASESDQDEVDYTAIIDYQWTDTVSTYLKVATGFRSGGSSRQGLDFNQAFDGETLVSYEFGWKTELWERRLRFNGAIYRMEVDDIILDYLPDPVNNPQFVEVFNSGDADIDGLELDVTAVLSERLMLGLSYAYIDYEINDAVFPDGSDRSSTTELIWAPEHAYAITADYSLPLEVGELRAHLDYTWQDDQFALANTEFGEVVVQDFGLINGRVSLADVNMLGGEWQFAVWGRNLTDEDSASYRIGATAASFLRVRTYGGEVIFTY